MSMVGKVWAMKVKRLGVVGASLQTLIHELGCDAMLHAQETGDARRCRELYEAMPAVTRKEGFKVWLHAYSPIRINGDGAIGILKITAKDFTPYNLEEAQKRPFWTLEAAKEMVKPTTYADVQAMLRRYIAAIREADADGKVYGKNGNVVKLFPVAELPRLRELAEKAAAIAA